MDENFVLCADLHEGMDCSHNDDHSFGPASRTICALKIPHGTGPHELYDIFCSFGTIDFISVIPPSRSGSTGSTKLFAFVIYKEESSAQDAASDNTFLLDGVEYVCKMSKSDYSLKKHNADKKRRKGKLMNFQRRRAAKRRGAERGGSGRKRPRSDYVFGGRGSMYLGAGTAGPVRGNMPGWNHVWGRGRGRGATSNDWGQRRGRGATSNVWGQGRGGRENAASWGPWVRPIDP